MLRRQAKSGKSKEYPTKIALTPAADKMPFQTHCYQILFPAFIVTGVLFTYAGQSLIPVIFEARRWQAIVYLVFGLVLFLLGALGYSRNRFPAWLEYVLASAGRWFSISPTQFFLILVSPFLSYGAWLCAGDESKMTLPVLAVALWILSILFLIAGSWQKLSRKECEAWPRWEIAAVIVLFFAAFALRAYHLDQIPWLLTGDEGSVGLNAVAFAQGERNNIFNVGWFAFPSLFFFLQSLPIRLLGQTVTGLRMASALAGALTVVALYWALRAAYGRTLSLAASAYLATFHFHIHFSRIGLNNIWDGFFFVIVSGALLRAWPKNRNSTFVLAGLSLGFCQYFYSSSKILPVMLILWLIVASIKDWKAVRSRLPGLMLLLLAAIIVILPLGIYYIQHPHDLAAPYTRVTLFRGGIISSFQANSQMVLNQLKIQIKNSFLAFTGTNLRFWYEIDDPMLLTLPATLFLMGLIILMINPLNLKNVWIFLWLLSSIALGTLSQDTPAAQRYCYIAPCVSFIVALPITYGAQWLGRTWPKRQIIILASFGLILALGMAYDLHYYFGEYAPCQRFSDLNTEIAQETAEFIQTQDPNFKVYFFGGRMGYFSHSSLPYLVPEADGEDCYDVLTALPDWELTGPTAFIFLPERSEDLLLVEKAYPNGTLHLKYGKDENLLFLAYVPPGT